jgi:hypothetical protein
MLDDLATEAAELQSQTAAARSDPLAGVPISDAPVPGDAADQPNRPGKPGGLLSRLAVTLLAVGFWGSRASLLGISNRRAGRPHDTRNAKVWKATGLHGSELDDDLDSSNGG